MDQYGNTTTFNIETVLMQNIKNNSYYQRTAFDIDTVTDLIDAVYESVDHVEPWMSGNARGPSTSFSLLYRLAQLKPSPGDLRAMLDHTDSPYIRAVGFLYLRFCCDPRKLWGWFAKYVRDSEEFKPSPGSSGRMVTIGEFARDLLLQQVSGVVAACTSWCPVDRLLSAYLVFPMVVCRSVRLCHPRPYPS
jgi:pre-mRNA-splicing factor 38B